MFAEEIKTITETASKKLFDDLVDYIHTRGEFKSDSLAQKNPNEFISGLADRMRSTRRLQLTSRTARRWRCGARLAPAQVVVLERE